MTTADALTSRLESFRSLRAEIEASILPLATSLDGRRFTFQAAIDGLELRLGGYVAFEGHEELGQVQALSTTEIDAGDVGLAGDGETDIRARLPIRLARGDGVILGGAGAPFHNRLARPAATDHIARWFAEHAPPGAGLAAGALVRAPDVPVALDAGGFDRHTFLCGQSGSGKSYSLGLLLEQLLLETDLRIVILDPNSDFARLHELRDDAHEGAVARWPELREGIVAESALRYADIDPAAQAALLHLDPIADREEYAELAERVADGSLATLGADAGRLGLRIANLGVTGWGVWARGAPRTVLDAVEDERIRCLVVDLGSLATHAEQALVAESVLQRLWDLRAGRRPVLVVIDEAHNVAPRHPASALVALATEHAVRIAGEGRKFGIYLLVASQRPQKVHENVLSQCDNLVLMRLNSPADAAFVRDLYGFAPPGLVELAPDFRLGEALVAGKVASHPLLLRFGRRVTHEGGSDVDATWAARR